MSIQMIGQKFSDYCTDRSANRRWVSVKNKVPVRPGTDTPIEWRQAENRYTWAQVQMIPGDYGIILDKTGLSCVDFDKCIDNGQVRPEVDTIICQLNTWCEISQSGSGIHAWIITDANTENIKPGGCYELITDGHVRVTGTPYPPYADKPIRLIDGDQLSSILRINPVPVRASYQVPEKIVNGIRNDELHRMACSLSAKGLSDEGVYAAVLTENAARCNPPLLESEVRTLVSSACQFNRRKPLPFQTITQVQTEQHQPARMGEPYTQIRIADQFVDGNIEDWRYNSDRKKWFHWNGKIWEEDDRDRIYTIVKDFLKDYLALVPNMAVGREIVELTRFIVGLNSAKGIRDVLAIAAPSMPLRDRDLDTQDYYLVCQNGTLNLQTKEFRAHSRDDFCSRITNTEYKPGAVCTLWEKHIRTILDEDQELIDSVQELLGYTLFLGNPDARFPVFFGSGRNGKTVTLECLSDLLGSYAVSISPAAMMAGGESAGSDRIRTRGARLITANEPSESSKSRCELDTGFIKAATGDDKVSARRLYCEGVTFKIRGLVILSTNSLPKIHDTSIAIWERVLAIPFLHYFAPEDRDRHILKKLSKEYPGILNWLITGYDRYAARGYLKPCVKITDQTEEYRRDEDYYTPFFDSGCVVIQKDSQVKAARLYTIYQDWFRLQFGEQKKPATTTRFGRDISTRFTKKHSRDGWYYYGIGETGQKVIVGG